MLNKYLDKKDSLFYKIDQLKSVNTNEEVKNALAAEPEQIEEEKKEDEKKIDKRMQEEIDRKVKLQKVMDYHGCSIKDIMNGFIGGFDYATVNGPLTEEPMEGACFIIDEVKLVRNEEEEKEDKPVKMVQDTFGSFQGQVISIVKDLCKKAFLNAKPRIAEGIYNCSL